jgi:hypothetical protein
VHDIDLTLRREFLKKPTRADRFNDTNAYLDKMSDEDQRRAKSDILGSNVLYSLFGIKHLSYLVVDAHLSFFGEQKRYGSKLVEDHEAILRITGLLTNDLKLEYESGYGNEDMCDCCGGFRSHILNSKQFGICDKCEKEHRHRNEAFWERRNEFIIEETWID